MAGSWERERRLDYIEDHLVSHGTLRRADVCSYFGVSDAQASLDIRDYLAQNPAGASYDRSAKVYRAPQFIHAVRWSNRHRRAAWNAFKDDIDFKEHIDG